MRTTRVRTFASAALGLSLVIAACGSDDDSASDEPSATTEQAAANDESAPATDAPEAEPDADAGSEPAETDAAPSGTGCDAVDLSVAPDSPVTIRMGHGAGTEEPLYLMAADPEGIGSQYNGTHYTLELTEYAPPDRLAAYQSGAMEGGTISAPQLFTAVNS